MNHQGKNNPFYGHKHTQQTTQKISKTQKLRYNKMRELLDEQKLENKIKRIVKEMLNNLDNILHLHE